MSLSQLLASQCGIVSLAQASEAGMSRAQVRTELRRGWWRPAFPGRRGVYVVGSGAQPLCHEQLVWAAHLAIGGAVLTCHDSAYWSWLGRGEPPALAHVAVLDGRSTRPLPGVRVHTLPNLEVPIADPVRRPPTVALAPAVMQTSHACRTARRALAVVDDAVFSRRVGAAALADALAAQKRHRHRRLLEAVLTDATEGAQGGLERRHLLCMRQHGLPTGERQLRQAVVSGNRYLDVVVRRGLSSPLVTELDGRLGHERTLDVFRDMDRDNAHELAGTGHLRYGALQVFDEPCRVAAQTRSALLGRGWTDVSCGCGPGCPLTPRSR